MYKRTKKTTKKVAKKGVKKTVTKKVTKKVAKKAAKKVVERVAKETVAQIKREIPHVDTPVTKRIVVDGSVVEKVLKDGHTPSHWHCACTDGTTRHVPKSEFV